MKIYIFLFPYFSLFQILYYKAFTSTNFITAEGWTLSNVNGTYSDCGGNRILGRHNMFGVQAQAMILLQLPPHFQIDITFEFWRIDSWGQQTLVCVHRLDIKLRSNLYILITSNLNEYSINVRIMGIRDFYLFLHLCPAGCTHCEANDQRWECIPWILLNSAFLSVTSAGFNYDGWTITGGTQSTSQCANVPLYGGYCLTAQNSELKQTYDLQFHTLLQIKFKIAFIDTWDDEYAYLYVDGKLEFQEKYQFEGGTFKGACGIALNDQFSTFRRIINHTADKRLIPK